MKKCLHSLLKCALISSFFLTLHFASFSQLSAGNYLEGGIVVAPMGFLGDLGGHFGKGTTFLKDYNMNTTKLSFGIAVTAHPSEWLGFRVALNYGGVSGDDANISTKSDGIEQARRNRNLNFRSNIYEGFIAGELYPTVFFENDPTDVQGRLRPYGLLGIGVFHFNPQGTDWNGDWVDLQPLHTEGQGIVAGKKPYALTQMNIPMGVGVKYYFTDNLNIAFELIHRKTFTDYIDDVSTTFVDPSVFTGPNATLSSYMSNKSPLRGVPNSGYNPGDKRGDPHQNDAYFTMGFKLGIRLVSKSTAEWRNSTHCPVLRF